MSRFLRPSLEVLEPYTPGEQPTGQKYIKLNTNESPFPPSKKAIEYAAEATRCQHLYPALNGGELRDKLAEIIGVSKDEIVVTNGSDEVLNFCFKAFCSETVPAAFADITYGFYSVFAGYNEIPYEIIPLKDNFTIDPDDYMGIGKTIFIANPNAPTGLILPVSDIERIVAANPDNVVVVDEAYIDFGGESCVPLIKKYKNLFVTRTFSKSRSLAGARVGFGIACPELISDIYRLIYSTNPYNLSRTNMTAALGSLEDDSYNMQNCREIIKTREYTENALKKLGFNVISSATNFLFASSPKISGGELYAGLKANGILVRHFNTPKIDNYLRITIGARQDMETLIEKITEILGG